MRRPSWRVISPGKSFGASALSRREPEGMLVAEVSGESLPISPDIPVEEGETSGDWEASVDRVDFHYHRPAWQRTDAEKRRARKERRRRNGPCQRQRTPSPGEGRRPNPDSNIVTEEERREMLEALVTARSQVEEWEGEIATEVFAGSRQEEELLLAGPPAAMLCRPREGEAEVSVEPPNALVVWRAAATLPPEPVSMISYVMGPHGLMFQPMQQQLQPWGFLQQHQQPYPLQQHQQELRQPQHRWQSCQLQQQQLQQHLQLARPPQPQQHQQPVLVPQQQQHQQEPMVVDRSHRADRLISPVFWPSPTSEDADAPSRSVRGENFGGLEPVAFVSGLDSPRGACFNCHESGHGRQQCRRRPMRVFCTNCGRGGVKVHACPRCGKAWRKSQRNWHTKKRSQKARLRSVVQKIQ
ncbi:unnamed protein product, partial [Trichogramma brassicae]